MPDVAEVFNERALKDALYELEAAKIEIMALLGRCTAMVDPPLAQWDSWVMAAALAHAYLKSAAAHCARSNEALRKFREQAAKDE